MGSGFSILDSLNKKSMADADRTSYARFRTSDISIYDIYSSDRNFYPQEGIEQKAAEILAVGLLSSLVVADIPSEDGIAYRLISGERRWRALCLLVENGYREFETVTCQIRKPQDEHTEMIELILANSSREKDIGTLIREEQTLKNELQYMKEHNIRLNGYDLQTGRLRDVIADMLNVSATKVAEMEKVANHLSPDFRKELDDGKMNFSAAYQLAKLQPEEQKQLHEKYQEEGELSHKEVKAYARKKEEECAEKQKRVPEETEQQIPGQTVLTQEGEVVEEDVQKGAGNDSEESSEEAAGNEKPDIHTALSILEKMIAEENDYVKMHSQGAVSEMAKRVMLAHQVKLDAFLCYKQQLEYWKG